MAKTKIIVLDDDPTGSQTVHSCLLLTRWDTASLLRALRDDAPLFFVLSNTRAMNAQRAGQVTRDICRHLRQAFRELSGEGESIAPVLVSRSDSTLRGHYPVETDSMEAELGPFDAHFLIPAFFEGGRFTRDSVHYLLVDGRPTPVHETEFARDSVFEFHHAYLPRYVEEKTQGRIGADDVQRFLLNDVRGDSLPRLLSLHGNACCVVDAETQADLNHFAEQLLQASQLGKRFLFRSAASLLTALARLPPQPVPAQAMYRYVRNARPGVILVGSHVAKTSEQLEYLQQHHPLAAVEVDVRELAGCEASWLQRREGLCAAMSERITAAHTANRHVLIFTSREELRFVDQEQRLQFGARLSDFMMDLVRHLPATIGYLISKGGITSNDVLSSGLALSAARVLGQVLPGCSVVNCPADHPRFPGLPVVIFPGNVGDKTALADVFRRLTDSGSHEIA